MNRGKNLSKNSHRVTRQTPELGNARYLVVLVDRGMASEVNYFPSFKEAKRTFGEIAHDYGYKPEEINGSDYYNVSIWEWTDNKYEKVYGY